MKSGTSATLSRRTLNADLDPTLTQYQSLVCRLAGQMIAKLPANVEIDDLINVGLVGLADALSHFDAAHDGGFEIFATKRIRSAMLDELRGSNYLSRDTRKQQRSTESALVGAIEALAEREQHVMSMFYEHDMNLKEIAAVLGVDESRVCELHSASVAQLRVKLTELNARPALASMCK
jgi:RNA polymerase sigma factor FliA